MGAHIDYETRRVTFERVFGERGLIGANGATENFGVDPWFEILGVNASIDDLIYEGEGGIRLTTDGVQNDSIIVVPHLDTEHSPLGNITWGTDDLVEWECTIRIKGETNYTCWLGLKLTNTDVLNTDDWQTYFRFQDGVSSDYWVGSTCVGSNNTHSMNVGTTMTRSGEILKFRIEFDNGHTAHMFINDREVQTRNFRSSDNDLIPYIGVKANGGQETFVIIRNMKISRILK